MSYIHIDNLYRAQTLLMFRECYALEKIDGTSAHVTYHRMGDQLTFSSGGASAVTFRALFDEKELHARCVALGYMSVRIYGEAYGGKQQGQGARYGSKLKFVVFDIAIPDFGTGEEWLTVPQADEVAEKLGLEFVHYVKSSTDLAALDAQRDAPSEQARRNGVLGEPTREGVILRPLLELRWGGQRIIAKHKRADFQETATPRPVVDPSTLRVLEDAEAIAIEWVTPMRLEHVLDKLPPPRVVERAEGAPPRIDMARTKEVIEAMVEDVLREGAGEIVDSKAARAAIGKRTVALLKGLTSPT